MYRELRAICRSLLLLRKEVLLLKDIESILSLLSVIVLIGSVVYGVCCFFLKRSALYFKILTLAAACYTLVSGFRLLYGICFGTLFEGVGITFLGCFGCFLFLFSANYGQYDSLIDDRSAFFAKYRSIALLAPVFTLALLALYTVGNIERTSVTTNIFTGLAYLPAVFASYYNLKHFLIPDTGFSFVKWVRLTNLCALLIEVLDIVRLYVRFCFGGAADGALSLLIAVIFFIMLTFARKGHRSWLV